MTVKTVTGATLFLRATNHNECLIEFEVEDSEETIMIHVKDCNKIVDDLVQHLPKNSVGVCHE